MSKLKLFLKKTILASIVAIGIFGGNQVFAQTPEAAGTINNPPTSITSTTKCRTVGDQSEECQLERQKVLTDRTSLIDDILRGMYLLLWPLIYLAGLAIDNGLVFGESIGLDLYLRKFWTMMVVIAYLGLGVSLLMTVYEGIKKGGDELIKLLKGQVSKTIQAAILIPLSRFIVQQLVNLSTLLVFTVGALPLNVNMEGATDCADDKNSNNALCNTVIQMHTRFNLTDVFGGDRSSLALYSTRERDTDIVDGIYMQCTIVNNTIDIKTFKEKIDDIKDPTKVGGEGLRKIGSEMVLSEGKPLGNKFTEKLSSDYCVLKANTLFDLKKKSGTGDTIGLFSKEYSDGIQSAKTQLANKQNIKIHSILDASKSAIGPLTTIYGSILDFGSITTSVSNNQGAVGAFVEAIMKGFQGIMLFIPLVGFVVVMMVRIGYLRVVIAFSPLIVLFNTVFKPEQLSGKMKDIKYFGNLGDSANWIELAKLILQPAIVMFALSIGLIVLSIMQQTLNLDQGALDYFNFGVTSETNNLSHSCFNLLGLQTICVEGAGLGYGVSILSDIFNRGILNIIGIMVVWALFFSALKSNKITQKVAENVQSIAENYVGTREVIPYGDKKVGFMAAKEGVSNIWEEISKVDGSEQYKKIIDPENKRLASGFAGDRSSMNEGITKDISKVKDNDDSSVLKSMVTNDSMVGNEHITLSDVDVGNRFKGQSARNALTELGPEKGSVFAGDMSYSDVKKILESKKHSAGRQDASKFIADINSKEKSLRNSNSLIIGSDGKTSYYITKNRAGKDAVMEIKYTLEDDNKTIKGIEEIKKSEISDSLIVDDNKSLSVVQGFVDGVNKLGLSETKIILEKLKGINAKTPTLGKMSLENKNSDGVVVSTEEYTLTEEVQGKLKLTKVPSPTPTPPPTGNR